jgi:hypothetical protein
VDGLVLGRVDGLFLGGEHVALLNLVYFRGLLGSSREVDVAVLLFRHWYSFPFRAVA